jgi:hypothetical protein
MFSTKYDQQLQKAMEQFKNRSETPFYIIIEINKEHIVRRGGIKSAVHYDNNGNEWKYERFIIPQDIRNIINENSMRVMHDNLEIIPAMSVQTIQGNVERIAALDFVKRIELSTKAKLSVDDSDRLIK